MEQAKKLTEIIDARNLHFTSAMKARLADLSAFSDRGLEWLVMEHYQFSFANKGLLQSAVATTKRLDEQGVWRELQRNVEEEDGHAPMYKKGMRQVGTDFDERVEYRPTTAFLAKLSELTAPSPSRALGALYATETAAIFEHEVFFDVCHEICQRRGAKWQGSLIKHFHDIHLSGGVEQSHKDGLGIFVDHVDDPERPAKEPIRRDEVLGGARAAIDAMEEWWTKLLDRALQLS